jgi:hypothetical protein
MKDILIAEIEKLKEKTQINGFLFKRYTKWINEVSSEQIRSPELIAFLSSKASFTDNKEYSLFLMKLVSISES